MIIKIRRLTAFTLSVFAMLVIASCEKSNTVNEIEIFNVVIRETPPGVEKGVAYLSIKNNTDENLTLNYVHSPRADVIEVHRHLYEDGLMKMRQIHHLNVDPSARIDFTPGGFHLMLFGLTDQFIEGQQVPLTFEFENKSPIEVVAEVKRH